MLLLDEPLAALDPMVRITLQTELKAIFQHLHQTVILVTHDPKIAEYAHRIIQLEDGRVVGS